MNRIQQIKSIVTPRAISTLLIILLSSVTFGQGHLKLELKPLNNSGTLEKASWASLIMADTPIDMIAVENGTSLVFKLEFDKFYTIDVNSKNYEKVTITVDTHVPKSDQGYVYSYSSSFDLVVKKQGHKAVFEGSSGFTVHFNKGKDSFAMKGTYNPKYTYQPVKEKPVKPTTTAKPDEKKAEDVPENVNLVAVEDKQIASPSSPELTNDSTLINQNITDAPTKENPILPKTPDTRSISLESILTSTEDKKIKSQIAEQRDNDERKIIDDKALNAAAKIRFLEIIAETKRDATLELNGIK